MHVRCDELLLLIRPFRSFEWWSTGQHFVDHAAKGVNVRSLIDRAPGSLLGREVGSRTEGGPTNRVLPGRDRLRQSEIDQLDGSVVSRE